MVGLFPLFLLRITHVTSHNLVGKYYRRAGDVRVNFMFRDLGTLRSPIMVNSQPSLLFEP